MNHFIITTEILRRKEKENIIIIITVTALIVVIITIDLENGMASLFATVAKNNFGVGDRLKQSEDKNTFRRILQIE